MQNYYFDCYFHAEKRNGSLLSTSQIMPAQSTDRVVENTFQAQICNSSRGMGGTKELCVGVWGKNSKDMKIFKIYISSYQAGIDWLLLFPHLVPSSLLLQKAAHCKFLKFPPQRVSNIQAYFYLMGIKEFAQDLLTSNNSFKLNLSFTFLPRSKVSK